MDVKTSLLLLKSYCEQANYKGWDPYDGLNSVVFKALPLRKLDFVRLGWIQAFKRSPINFRSLFGVPKEHNAKGLGLFLSGYCSLYEFSQGGDHSFGSPDELRKKIVELADLLLSMKSPGYSGACWGYNFDWQARRLFLFPKNTPTVVATTFCVDALFKAYEITKNQEYLTVALSSANFVLNDLRRTKVANGIILSYSALSGNDTVYNASLLGAKLLSLCYAYTKNDLYKSVAKEIVGAACAAQNEQGGWVYGLLPIQSWIDSFHTGYNLDALAHYAKNCSDRDYDAYIEKGFRYYLKQFFLDDGTPKYYQNKVYPIDIHSPAQLLFTLNSLDSWAKNARLVDKVLCWTIDNMFDHKGYFYYQIKRSVSSKISYMRWSNAFMFSALSLYFANNKKYAIHHHDFSGSFATVANNAPSIKQGITITLSTAAPGGIRSVVDAYSYDGFLPAWNGFVLFTHKSGFSLARLGLGLERLAIFIYYLTFKKVRLVHCHVSSYGSFWRKAVFAKIAKVFGVPVILHMHGGRFELFYNSSNHVIKKIISNVLQGVNSVVVLSDYWKSFVNDIAALSNILVIPNYVRVPVLPLRAIDGGLIKITFLGFIGQNKGVYDLIPAFCDVLISAGKFNNIQLHIVGNGEVNKARAMTDSLGISDNVSVIGWVDSCSAQELLQETDIFVLPSYHEGLPVAVIEAMAWGIPVVVSPVGAVTELIQDGCNGLLVKPGDRAGLAEAISKLCNDVELRKKIGTNARQTIINKYSDLVVLPKLNDLYSMLINKHK